MRPVACRKTSPPRIHRAQAVAREWREAVASVAQARNAVGDIEQDRRERLTK